MPISTTAARRLLGPLLLAVALVAGCDATGATPSGTPETTPAAGLPGTSWTLAAVGPNPAVAGFDAWLEFGGNGELSGSTGCNNLVGSYAVDGAALTFSTVGTSRRGCEDPIRAQDTAVPEALTSVTGWQIDGDGLLHLTGGAELVFTPRSS